MNATNLDFVRNRVYRKSDKKPHAKARRRKVNKLTIFAPLREKFHAAIFLLLHVVPMPHVTSLQQANNKELAIFVQIGYPAFMVSKSLAQIREAGDAHRND